MIGLLNKIVCHVTLCILCYLQFPHARFTPSNFTRIMFVCTTLDIHIVQSWLKKFHQWVIRGSNCQGHSGRIGDGGLKNQQCRWLEKFAASRNFKRKPVTTQFWVAYIWLWNLKNLKSIHPYMIENFEVQRVNCDMWS